MDEKTALEEIQYIRKVIDETRRSVAYNGMDYIVWGILVITGMMLMYILILSEIHFNYVWIWTVLISIGWIFSIYSGFRHHKKMPQTYSKRMVTSVWLATGVGMTITGFLAPASGAISPMAISPLVSLMVGGAYFISGKILDSDLFSKLSYGWWAGAVILFFVHSVHQFLIMSLIMLFFQTIPGIIIYRKYKQEVQVAQ